MFGSQKNEKGKWINRKVSKSPERKKPKNPKNNNSKKSQIQKEPSKWISKIYKDETLSLGN